MAISLYTYSCYFRGTSLETMVWEDVTVAATSELQAVGFCRNKLKELYPKDWDEFSLNLESVERSVEVSPYQTRPQPEAQATEFYNQLLPNLEFYCMVGMLDGDVSDHVDLEPTPSGWVVSWSRQYCHHHLMLHTDFYGIKY